MWKDQLLVRKINIQHLKCTTKMPTFQKAGKTVWICKWIARTQLQRQRAASHQVWLIMPLPTRTLYVQPPWWAGVEIQMLFVACVRQRAKDGGSAGFSHWSVRRLTFHSCFLFISSEEKNEEVNAAAAPVDVATSYCCGSSCVLFCCCCCYQSQKCWPAFEKPLLLLSSNTKVSF